MLNKAGVSSVIPTTRDSKKHQIAANQWFAVFLIRTSYARNTKKTRRCDPLVVPLVKDCVRLISPFLSLNFLTYKLHQYAENRYCRFSVLHACLLYHSQSQAVLLDSTVALLKAAVDGFQNGAESRTIDLGTAMRTFERGT